MTFGEVSWLLFGAVLGAAAAYAIPVRDKPHRTTQAPSQFAGGSAQHSGAGTRPDVPEPRISD